MTQFITATGKGLPGENSLIVGTLPLESGLCVRAGVVSTPEACRTCRAIQHAAVVRYKNTHEGSINDEHL